MTLKEKPTVTIRNCKTPHERKTALKAVEDFIRYQHDDETIMDYGDLSFEVNLTEAGNISTELQ